MAGSNHDRREFTTKVGAKEARKIRARRQKEHSIWQGIGMMGIVGWAVALPTLIGIAVGLWLDRKFPGAVSWTLTLLFVGLVIGCLNAYHWVRKEIDRIHRRQDDA